MPERMDTCEAPRDDVVFNRDIARFHLVEDGPFPRRCRFRLIRRLGAQAFDLAEDRRKGFEGDRGGRVDHGGQSVRGESERVEDEIQQNRAQRHERRILP